MLKVLKNGYKFDKRIFRGCIIFIFLLGLLAWGLSGWNLNFFRISCNKPLCENPVFMQNLSYVPPEINTMEFIPFGFKFGNEPSWLMKNYFFVVVFSVALAFAYNHRLHNWGWK